MSRPLASAIACFAAMLFLSGCGTKVRATFEDHPPDQVFSAMVAAAKSPSYSDWHVLRNDVFVDDSIQRLEVYRELARTVKKPRSRPVEESKTWKFRIDLERTDPLSVLFTSRVTALPVNAQYEANRYFADVRDVLAGEQSGRPVEAAGVPVR